MPNDATTRFVASSAASAFAETATLPTDVAKVRLQVQTGGAPRYAGLLDCLQKTAAQEGVAACWKGLAPALIRQVCYSSLTLVLYEPVRAVLSPSGDASFGSRLLAGGTAGAIAISVFNPTEVLKTRMQTATEATSMRGVLASAYQSGGILGFWAGLQPNVARTFLVNAAELGTYDQAKESLKPLLGDGPLAHISASGVAGVASACTSTPADVIKTRLMNQSTLSAPTGGGGAATAAYAGPVDALRCILRDEGAAALYKGFVPIVVRKVLWCSIFFVSYEQIRTAVGLRGDGKK